VELRPNESVLATRAQTIAVNDLGGFFEGSWSLDRSVRHDGEPAPFYFRGIARFSSRSRQLDYYEAGEIARAGDRFEAERRYTVTEIDGPRAKVTFADGRPFYDIDLSSGEWTGCHECDRDTYLFSFTVTGADSFVERWVVSGPRKSYCSVTFFARMAA
jgi:hypothetical protein